jgi:S1-C subfamily serine protease
VPPARRYGLARVVAVALTVSLATSLAAADKADYQKFLKDKEAPLVTVKYVLKVKMGGMMGGMGDQESDSEITGVLISEKGLVLCSNTQLGGFTSLMRRFMGRMGGEMTATPTDLKVLVGDDTEGKEAELVARDSDLDLAWVKIKDPGDTKYPFVDFSKGRKPEIGERIMLVHKMGKYFARTAVVGEGRIGGETAKPRDLFVPSGIEAGGLGLPIYAADGQVLGVTVIQAPDEEDAEANPMAMLSRMSDLQSMMAGLILPAAEVAKATTRALESAQGQ